LKKIASITCSPILTALLLANAFSVAAQGGDSLYKRLGGYDAIAKVSDEFLDGLAKDKQLSRFLTGLSESSQKHLRQHVVDFLCQATGGPCVYTGRDMKTVHTGLKITDSDWDATVKLLSGVQDKLKVPKKEKGETLAAVAGLKSDIVGR